MFITGLKHVRLTHTMYPGESVVRYRFHTERRTYTGILLTGEQQPVYILHFILANH